MAIDLLPDALGPDVEFWRIERVRQVVGLSRSEIYRRMRDSTLKENPFPKSHRYRGSQTKFWRSDEVREWQARELGEDPVPRARSLEEMIG
jgi:predicted DNA-binding transcriptional regulator AlpA